MATCLLNPCNPCVAISQACIGDNALAMNTVAATPGICQQKGQSAACSATCYLNTIGKWGTTLAAVFTCRPVQSNRGAVSVAPKGSSGIISGGNLSNLLVFAIIVFVIYLVLEHS